MRIFVLDGGGPKDSENTLNSFLTKCGEKVLWQIGADMHRGWGPLKSAVSAKKARQGYETKLLEGTDTFTYFGS